jgi:hypothetical protein
MHAGRAYMPTEEARTVVGGRARLQGRGVHACGGGVCTPVMRAHTWVEGACMGVGRARTAI